MADKHGPACPQRFPTDLANETEALTSMSKVRRDYLLHVQQTLAKNQSEDCLHLNIYAPLQGKFTRFLYFLSFISAYVCVCVRHLLSYNLCAMSQATYAVDLVHGSV